MLSHLVQLSGSVQRLTSNVLPSLVSPLAAAELLAKAAERPPRSAKL
jgi:hypothetical protein